MSEMRSCPMIQKRRPSGERFASLPTRSLTHPFAARMRGLLSDYGLAIMFDDHDRIRETAKAIRLAIASALVPGSDKAH